MAHHDVRQKKMKTTTITLALLSMSLFGCRGGGEWDGGASITAEIRVISDLGDYPVENALVEFVSRRRESLYVGLSRADREAALKAEDALATTNIEGVAVLTLKGGAGGTRTAFGVSGSKGFSGELLVTAPRFKPYSTSIRNHIEKSFDLDSEKVKISVYLIPENEK